MTQGSMSGRKSIKSGRFQNIDGFSSAAYPQNLDDDGLASRKLRRQKSITNANQIINAGSGVLDISGGENDFKEVNLSMVNPYKKNTDLATDTDALPDNLDNSEAIKNEVIVNASNKNQFAKGLANLPENQNEDRA